VRTIVLLTSRQADNNGIVNYSPPPVDTFAELTSGTLTVEQAIAELEYEVDVTSLAQSSWSFAKRDTESLLTKLQVHSETLKDYCNGQVCMGVKSGLTEAFVIDAATRDEIIKQNAESAQIIKPLLNGRDVRRYQIEDKTSFDLHASRHQHQKYPAVEAHLRPFKQRLENARRNKRGMNFNNRNTDSRLSWKAKR
jgi:hypothetical protein